MPHRDKLKAEKKKQVKKKSIKTALSSYAGSKRKLSRMGKKQKKDHAGMEASFLTRPQCLKRLQVTLKDFRRLCILKGVYPREPLGRIPNKKRGHTLYHIKDIRSIAHEPVLEKFRAIRAFMKKIRRAAGRNEKDEALRKNSLLPQYTLHHLVKERYPRFMDALGDVDDALTLTHLFAAVPGSREHDIRPAVVSKAKSIVAAWGAYCATTSAITKTFISVKGVYMEASIHTVPVRWIIPHSFTQYMPTDVDYNVMYTFFEFYETLLNFVLFKLFSEIGVRYPITVKELLAVGKDVANSTAGSTTSLLAANLRALTHALNTSKGSVSKIVTASIKQGSTSQSQAEQTSINKSNQKKTKESSELSKSVKEALDRLAAKDDKAGSGKNDEEDGDDDDDDDEDADVDLAGPLQAALENVANQEARSFMPTGTDVDEDTVKRRRLFQGLTFFLSREVPRGYLELTCLAYGGKVGWEGEHSPISIEDTSITHHVVDRPKLPSSYASILPKNAREFIQPQWIVDCANHMVLLPIERYSVGATLPPHLSPWVDHEEEGYKPAYAEEIERIKNGLPVEFNNGTGEVEATTGESEDVADSHEQEQQPDKEDAVALDEMKENSAANQEDDEDGDEEEEENEEEEEEEIEDEEEDERVRAKREKARKAEEEEAHKLAKSMMSRKAAHLYGRMQHGIAKKQAKADALHQKRQEQEATAISKKSETGKSTQKQRVERLKKTRKRIESTYGGANSKKARKQE